MKGLKWQVLAYTVAIMCTVVFGAICIDGVNTYKAVTEVTRG